MSPLSVALMGYPLLALFPYPCEEKAGLASLQGCPALMCQHLCWVCQGYANEYPEIQAPLPPIQSSGMLGDTQAVWATQRDLMGEGKPLLT